MSNLMRRGAATLLRWLSRPSGRNDAWAELLECLGRSTAVEERALVVRRNAYRDAWHHAMHKQGVDFVLTVPHALPPMPKDGTAVATLISANYAFLFTS